MKASSRAPRLHVLVAGAGIGGLSAAIALRQAGHVVEVGETELTNLKILLIAM